jgi:predicted MFS family arabinose efflux permease
MAGQRRRDVSGTAVTSSSCPGAAGIDLLHPGRLVPPGIAIVAVTFGLARYAYGLFLPDTQASLQLSLPAMGAIAGVSYVGFLLAVLLAIWAAPRLGPRRLVVAGGLAAALGMALIATADNAATLALGVFIAGSSPGFSYTPLSEVIMRRVVEPAREKVYAWINAGTGFGVVVAGPVAIAAGADWRLAWACFAAIALISVLWVGLVLKGGGAPGPVAPAAGASGASRSASLLRPGALALFASATTFGLITSVYWTFAVDLLVTDSGVSADQAKLFWTVVGIAGIGGCMTGHLVRRSGIRRSWRRFMAALALATAGLPALAALPCAPLLSGVLFGVAFITVTALYGMWAMSLFRDRPSAGFGMVFFLVSLGQFAGPVMAGLIAPQIGMVAVFLGSALAAVLMLAAAPGRDFSSMG